MAVIPILEPALGDFAGALAVSTIEPNDRRFRTTDYSLAVTDGAPDRNIIKIVGGLAHLPINRLRSQSKDPSKPHYSCHPDASHGHFAASQRTNNSNRRHHIV
jgi:hypothetical protein